MRMSKPSPSSGLLDLLPALSVTFLLIPILLLAMDVSNFATIAVSSPNFCGATWHDRNAPKPLNLKVFVMADGFRVSAAGQQHSGRPGQDRDRDATTIALARPGAAWDDFDRYDYAALEATANRYKTLFPHETHVTISAENNVPLAALVSTLDALRGSGCHLRSGAPGEIAPECLFWNPIVEARAG